MKTKKIFGILLAIMLVFSVLPVGADEVFANTSEIRVILNGDEISFDQPPIIEYGRTLVPFRAIFEAMGADVDWNPETRTVTASRQGINIKLIIGSNILLRNGVEIELDVPARIASDRTLVPVRAIAESFNADVDWDYVTRTVYIEDLTYTGLSQEQIADIIREATEALQNSEWLSATFKTHYRGYTNIHARLTEYRTTDTVLHEEVVLPANTLARARDAVFPEISDLVNMLNQLPNEAIRNASVDNFDGRLSFSVHFQEEVIPENRQAWLPQHSFVFDVEERVLLTYFTSSLPVVWAEDGEWTAPAPPRNLTIEITFEYMRIAIPPM